MDKNKYIAVSYKLYATDNENELIEEAPVDKPFQFISGLGIAIPAFESKMLNMTTGDTFDFTLSKGDAYGDYDIKRVIDLDKKMFEINGRFDSEQIYEGAIVPLVNADGNHFNGKVLEIKDDKVTMDLNHPLAGKDLHFIGTLVENRDASRDEVEGMVNMLNYHGGCGCGCEEDECEGHSHEGGCGCGHHHHHEDGHCKGHCHHH